MSVAAASTLAAAPSAAPVTPAVTLPFAPATAAIPLLGWATLVAWVYQDALAREVDRPVGSALGVAVFPPALVAYVRYRGERTAEQSDRERLTLAVLLAILAAMIVGTVFSPLDVFAQPRNTFGALLLTLPLFYLLVYRQPPDEESDGEGADEAGEESNGERNEADEESDTDGEKSDGQTA